MTLQKVKTHLLSAFALHPGQAQLDELPRSLSKPGRSFLSDEMKTRYVDLPGSRYDQPGLK